MDKMEAYMLESAIENMRALENWLKSRDKDRKNSYYAKENTVSVAVQVLDQLVELIYLTINRQKFNRPVEEVLGEIQVNEQEQNSYRRERRISGDFDIESKEWGADVAKDSFGKTVINKFEKLVALLDAPAATNGLS